MKKARILIKNSRKERLAGMFMGVLVFLQFCAEIFFPRVFDNTAFAVPAELAHWGSTIVDEESIAMMAGSLGLEGQTNWYYYNSNDAPEGAYLGWLNQNQTLVGTVGLPQQLSPGRYYIFFYGISYDSNETLQAAIGGGTSTSIVLNDRDVNKLWSDRAVIDVLYPSDSLQLTLTRNSSVTTDQKYLLRAIYITSNENETVTADGVAVNMVYPSIMDDSAPIKGNLIPNGGFETGVDASWGFPGQGSGRTVPVNTMWDSTQGHNGQGSIKLVFDSATRIQPTNNSEAVISRPYHLKPNKKYTVSAWVKAPVGPTTYFSIGLRNTYVPPPEFGTQQTFSSEAIAVPQNAWTRVSAAGYAVAYPTSDYQIYTGGGGHSGMYLLIDDIQLEEGDLTDFTPASVVEAAPVIDMGAKPGNIFYADESLNTSLVVRNSSDIAQTKTLHYEIYDFMNRVVRNGNTNISVPAHTTQNLSFDLSIGGKKGIFRAVTWIENDDRTEREVTYSIIPRTATTAADSTSFLGIHPSYTDFQLKMLQRLGMKWSRVLSPSAFCRWKNIEPVDDQFIWYDNEAQLGNSYGFTTMCTIGTNDYWPTWADQGGLPNLDEWQESVEQIVTHYKPWIKYWEIWNEPMGTFNYDFYAQMLKRAADAIEAADPTAKVVGMGGIAPSYMQGVINSLQTLYPTWDWKQHIDVLSTHDYPGGIPPESLKTIMDTYDTAIWNTETGAWDLGFYQGVNSNFNAWGKNIWPHADAIRYYNGMIGAANEVVKNFLRTIASGQTKYFYYDSRYYAAPDYFKHHPTILDYDGTIKAKGIAYAIAGSLIDHSIGMGNASVNPNSYFLVFDKPNAPVASLFSANNKPMQVTLNLNASQFRVLDIMGNLVAISESTVSYGRIPVYIEGIGISSATLKSALASGVITTRPDIVAPNVSISDAPRGPSSNSSFRVRWVGIDDISYPNIGEINPESNVSFDIPNPNAILYSYRLVGQTDSWSTWVPNT